MCGREKKIIKRKSHPTRIVTRPMHRIACIRAYGTVSRSAHTSNGVTLTTYEIWIFETFQPLDFPSVVLVCIFYLLCNQTREIASRNKYWQIGMQAVQHMKQNDLWNLKKKKKQKTNPPWAARIRSAIAMIKTSEMCKYLPWISSTQMLRSSRNVFKCGKHWHRQSSSLRYFPPITSKKTQDASANKHKDGETDNRIWE